MKKRGSGNFEKKPKRAKRNGPKQSPSPKDLSSNRGPQSRPKKPLHSAHHVSSTEAISRHSTCQAEESLQPPAVAEHGSQKLLRQTEPSASVKSPHPRTDPRASNQPPNSVKAPSRQASSSPRVSARRSAELHTPDKRGPRACRRQNRSPTRASVAAEVLSIRHVSHFQQKKSHFCTISKARFLAVRVSFTL